MNRRTVLETVKDIKSGKIRIKDLIQECIENIEKKDNTYNAFISLNKENALDRAEKLQTRLDAGEDIGILGGIPVAIKDNILVEGLKTTCGSKMLENYMAPYSATVINKLEENGAIIIGKTNMDEFAMGSTGETSYFKNTLNPFDNTLTPGGSSSGSAACVAARITPFALGTDTGGSIRQPASFCGLVGLKPTYGRVSRFGVIAFASSLDQVGPMTRNVYENALLLNAISGHDENDLTSSYKEVKDYTSLIGKDIKGLKVAIPNYYMSDVINNEVKENVLKVVELLKANGAIVEYVDIKYLEYAIPLYQIIALAEASSNLARYDGIRYGFSKEGKSIDDIYINTRTEGFGDEVKRRLMIGSHILSGKNAKEYYYKALSVRREMTESFKEVFLNYDLIIGPTNTNVAYKLGIKNDDALKSFYDDLLTIPVNMAGLPAISLPIGFNHDNLPIGMHIIGNYFEEDRIYQLASFIEDKLNLDTTPKGVK